MIQKIEPAAAIRLLDAKKAQAVDVREPDEYAVGHIPGAKLLPLGEVMSRAAEVLPDKDASPPSKMQEFHRYFTINLTIHRSVPNVKQNEKERPQTFHILFADCSKLTQRNSIFIRYNKGAVGKTET